MDIHAWRGKPLYSLCRNEKEENVRLLELRRLAKVTEVIASTL